ncbi:unnamed protein product [Cuscuta campestris]|uniref:AAA+ ATPase domain-containing protein n=1 Tax=Cuscuta campestris TaxID=132261 RepID=A0A484MYF4_9ASTE|nr:unnamed protein product [Cuscuta campestris]
MANKHQEKKCPIKSDFFVKVSEKRHQKRQQTQQLGLGSAEEDGKTSSPAELAGNMTTPRKRKHRGNSTPEKAQNRAEKHYATPEKTVNSAEKCQKSTPKKRGIKNGLMEGCIMPASCSLMEDELSPSVIPNLRMEAQKTAEENSRIYAGKEIHPFFSSWKMSKQKSEAINMERTWCSPDKEGKNLTLAPIHVLDIVEEDDITVDWQHWTFSEKCILNRSYILEHGRSPLCVGFVSSCSPLYEGFVSSLEFDTFHCPSNAYRPLLYQYGISVDLHSASEKESCFIDFTGEPHLLRLTSPTHLAEGTILQECSKNSEDNENGTHSSFLNISSRLSPDTEKHDRFLGGGMMRQSQVLCSHPENFLWTNKYQPEKAVQVCGNGASVKILSDWLHSWLEKVSQKNKGITWSDTFVDVEARDNIYVSDCDSDDDIENHLQNVLLITGPVGCGKSAAIYACAKEQGFQVIEVNSSDWRNGALVKQRFGEAVESHWIQRTQGTPNPEDQHLVMPCSAAKTGTEGSRSEVIELMPLFTDEDSQFTSAMPRNPIYKHRTDCHGDLRTLVLFEDVDAALCEDRGFISTIQQLSETAKRPMILTSNSVNPVLPNNLDRLELCFAIPPFNDVLELAHTICTAEQAEIDTSLVERFVSHCEGDIRKTIMLLQFWCQGLIFQNGNKLRTYRPLLFDINAGHLMLPKIIHSSFPSPLSALVDEEITKSMRMAEDSFGLGDTVEEERLNGNSIQNIFKEFEDPNGIISKKEAMLSLHGSPPDKNVHTPKLDSNSELSNYSGSPVTFCRRNSRRKLDAVMVSDSDEECFSSRKTVDLNEVPCDNCEEANEMMFNSPPDVSSTEMCCSILSKPLLCKRKRLKRKCSKADGSFHPNAMSASCDFSCVPESSFVPESKFSIDSKLTYGTDSYINVSCKVEADSANGLLPSCMHHEYDKHDDTVLETCNNLELLGCSSDINSISVCGGEAAQYIAQCVEDSSGAYQPLDECSRIDFNWRSLAVAHDKHYLSINYVQETWKKLRNGYMNIKQYATSDQKDTSEALNICYRLSNLISEADLLSNDCQQLICDSLDSSMIPCDSLQSYSWHDDQLQMSSIVAQHGICLLAKEVANLELDNVSVNKLDLASEMLASSDSTMSLGKLVGLGRRETRTTEVRPLKSSYSKRKNSSDVVNILQSAVPLRSFLSVKGGAFYEYLSALSRISRLEANQLSDCVSRSRQRRARVDRHYLACGGLSLSTEDMSLLCNYNCYHNVSSNAESSEAKV